MPKVLSLEGCAGEPVARVGRKAAVLGWAASAGMRTPGGFVLPASRFWAAVAACGAMERARYLESAAQRLDPRHVLDLAASVEAAMGLPAVDELAAADAAALFEVVGGQGPVVCRSSAAMEDGRRAAFPGVFRSVLGIESPAGLAAAVAACWRSAFSAGVMRYLLRLRVEPVDLSLALIVQPQVEAAWSGVYVSVGVAGGGDGGGGPRADLSDAGPDAVVGGRPAVVSAHRGPDGWAGVAAAPWLAGPLEAVHAMAGVLGAHLGAGVDVEFAVPADDGGGGGGPVLLQCRPLTAVAAAGRRVAGVAGADVAVVDHLTTADYGIVFRSTAVVMEQHASPLSHVALLCRELGVPLVGGVAGARSLAGRRVVVDSGAGTVDVVHDDAPAQVAVAAPAPAGAAPAPAMPAGELLLRALVHAGPGRPPAAVAARLAQRFAVVPHPIDAGELDELHRLGTELFGPSFSCAALLAGGPARSV